MFDNITLYIFVFVIIRYGTRRKDQKSYRSPWCVKEVSLT
jgi:hypothetical protein